jgi:hypothetical protein
MHHQRCDPIRVASFTRASQRGATRSVGQGDVSPMRERQAQQAAVPATGALRGGAPRGSARSLFSVVAAMVATMVGGEQVQDRRALVLAAGICVEHLGEERRPAPYHPPDLRLFIRPQRFQNRGQRVGFCILSLIKFLCPGVVGL